MATSARTPSEPAGLLRPAEVARMFRVDPATVARWVKAGKLPAFRTPGGHLRIYEYVVRRMLRGEL